MARSRRSSTSVKAPASDLCRHKRSNHDFSGYLCVQQSNVLMAP